MNQAHLHAGRDRQIGAALFVSIVMLILITLLVLASVRGTGIQEKMSSGLYDRNLAFQAVEAALREGESLVRPGANPSFPASGCNAGLCAAPDASNTDRWLDAGFTGWRNATGDMGPRMASAAQFFVESMGTAPRWYGCDRELPVSPYCLAPRYRVTARINSAGRAKVLLQTIYVPS